MKTNDIRKLEEEYFKRIIEIFHEDDEFNQNLLEVEDFIRKNYAHLDDLWAEKNKAKVAVERLIRYHLYKNLDVKNIYPSPLSPDMAIELKDVILCVDAKTIDMCGNPGDDDTIHFQKNQITFENELMYGQFIDGCFWPGFGFPPRLKSFYKGKPCLTYFITVNYEDDGSSFKLSHVCFCSVPHSKIAEKDFNNKLISNFKTYEYIGKKEAEQLGKNFEPIEKVPDNWTSRTISIEGENRVTTAKIYLDKNLSNPKNNIFHIRKYQDSRWKITCMGGSARINKETLKKPRKGHNGIDWQGLKQFRVGTGHKSGYETSGIYWNPSKKKPQGSENMTLNRVSVINGLEKL